MVRYLAHRVLSLIPVVLGMTIIVFVTLYLSGGDPTIALAGDQASQDPDPG
jgi:ABC-type dipeptide/oligopeptide/nickel transport system permease component